MHAFFKPNNIIAIFVAIILMGIGFTLAVFNPQRSNNADTVVPDAKLSGHVPTSKESLSKVASIHAGRHSTTAGTPDKSELQIIRDSIDWSDAPLPRPELIKTDDYDVYINVSKEYLLYVFDKIGYTGEKIDSGETIAIPPLIVVQINKGWSDNQTVQFKKSIFYRVMLALILYENEAVERERDELLELLAGRADDGSFSIQIMRRLNHLAYSYRVSKEESNAPLSEEQLAELLIRVDTVPPSLALAQAAHESGYATSRYAFSANALFGQWDWSADAVKPQQQRKGMGNYGIRSFDQPIDSVRSYIWNLNTLPAYADFRQERVAQRAGQAGRIIFDSQKLADTLTSYSERNSEYTEELKETIRSNRLQRADHLRLMQGDPVYFN